MSNLEVGKSSKRIEIPSTVEGWHDRYIEVYQRFVRDNKDSEPLSEDNFRTTYGWFHKSLQAAVMCLKYGSEVVKEDSYTNWTHSFSQEFNKAMEEMIKFKDKFYKDHPLYEETKGNLLEIAAGDFENIIENLKNFMGDIRDIQQKVESDLDIDHETSRVEVLTEIGHAIEEIEETGESDAENILYFHGPVHKQEIVIRTEELMHKEVA